MKTPDDHISRVAKALSDKTRVRILRDIARRGSISCGDTIEAERLSQPTLSHHVKVLVDAGLLIAEKNGRHVMITINREAVKDFLDLVTESTKR